MLLSAAQIERMSRLLDEALPLDGAGRLRWFDSLGLGGEDQDLSQALYEALFGSEAAQLSTLPKLAGTAPDPDGRLHSGDRVGPYLLIRQLGSGGMAEVWLARRADGAPKRDVALKLPKVASARKDLTSRFER